MPTLGLGVPATRRDPYAEIHTPRLPAITRVPSFQKRAPGLSIAVGRSFFGKIAEIPSKSSIRMIDKLKKKLGEEAERLQRELNVVLPQEIRRAVELGDLRENSEYKAALERQQFVQARLGQLRQRLSKLSQIDVSQIPADKVGLGSQVVVQDEKTGERESYSLVFGDSVEFEEGHVSMSSPIGKTLVGRSVGETVVLKLPAMTRRLKIIELKTIHDAA